jgi:hypothetical protein
MHLGLDPESAGAVTDCARWTTTYPLQKVKKRHREEAICPMMAPALAARSVYFSVKRVSDRELPLESLDTILREAAAVFEEKIVSPDPRLRCLVLVVPGVRGGRLLEATDPAREIKNELLRRGILVGEFFPGCPFATTFNPRLFALRSPAPMYVLRSFVESDWRFICQIPCVAAHLPGTLWRAAGKTAAPRRAALAAAAEDFVAGRRGEKTILSLSRRSGRL